MSWHYSLTARCKKERLIFFCSWKAIYINEIIQNKNIRFVSEREYAFEYLLFLNKSIIKIHDTKF